MSIKFAVGLYSVRDELTKDLWGTLRKVKSLGYDGVEFYGDFAHTAQEIKAVLDDTGLVCVGWHTPWHNVASDRIMGTITYNKIIGNKEIVIPGLPDEMTNNKAALLNTAKAFNEVAEKLADYGMCLAYHNHGVEFTNIEGDLMIHYLFDNTCKVGLQLDNGNALTAGPDTDIYDPLTRYPNRVRTIHHKPYSHKNGYATMFGEADDVIDWGRMFKLCREHHNVDWHIVEYECDLYGQIEGIEKSILALKKMEQEGVIS